jgi:hypothetical protein
LISLILYAVLAIAGAGLVLKWALERFNRTGARITWFEFKVEMMIMAIVVVPLTAWIGTTVARSNLLTFHEYWNGWEMRAERTDYTCTRDGPCTHEYDCDPYIVQVSYSCGKDNKDTCYRPETRYHDCPYVNVETSYSVATTVGSFSIAEHRFPANPDQNRWRWGHAVPDYISASAGVGIPAFWLAAKQRVEAGTPGPVTKQMSYKNYILASDQTILKQYSASIQHFVEVKLMPQVTHDIHDFYAADKVHFVGYVPDDPQGWQHSLAYLTAALGSELQGDLQVVVTNAKEINDNPDAYAIALKAYWQDVSVFDRDAFSKNSIGIVVGTTDGKTIAWARAFTGMPLGNEALTVALRSDLKGVALTPDTLFGVVHGEFQTGKPPVRSVRTGGALPAILWGDANPPTKFERVSMTANDKTDHGGGFLYLSSEIQPTDTQRIIIILCAFLLGLMAWGVCAVGDGDTFFRQIFNSNRRWKDTQ